MPNVVKRGIRNQPKPEEPVVPPRKPFQLTTFPPRQEFPTLSLRDVLEARDAYHVHLSHMENVVATAVGRYLFHEKEWYATHPLDEARPEEFPRPKTPRTLTNSRVRSWSPPCVLVFVREWERSKHLGGQAIPKILYLPDGRQVRTCVVIGTPDTASPPPVTEVAFSSEMLGGSYPCERFGQGVTALGTVACLVSRGGVWYALTNKHVAGAAGEEVFALVRGERVRIGVTDASSLSKQTLTSIFSGYAASHAFINLDAGLVRLDDVSQWTSQVYGIGEIGEIFDATETTINLELIGSPMRAFGGVSTVIEGEIKALFFRYQSFGDYDYVSDLLIGARTPDESNDRRRPPKPNPETHPGDSGSLWFYDPPTKHTNGNSVPGAPQLGPPERGLRARRLRPVAMQWGGQRMALPDKQKSAFALATFVSTVCRTLDVEIVRTWSLGHDEYWGKIGHFAVGWKACALLRESLGSLMKSNQANIGFGDDTLKLGSKFTMGRGKFVPLADVPDYVYIGLSKNKKFPARAAEPTQHFADIDIPAIDGGPSMLKACAADPKNLAPAVWRDYFDGFAQAGCGPEEGSLPFRVWQLWNIMVSAARRKNTKEFVAAAGIMAHYVGDASQPLHSSYLHHGYLPMQMVSSRQYPVTHGSKEYQDFKKTRESKIHSIYEERMLEVEPLVALTAVDASIKRLKVAANVKNGWEAAHATFALMRGAHDRLPPKVIIAADDPALTERARAERLWSNKQIRDETVRSLALSTVTLASLWASAWKVGNGNSIPKSRIRAFKEEEVSATYRSPNFVPAMTLKAMAAGRAFGLP